MNGKKKRMSLDCSISASVLRKAAVEISLPPNNQSETSKNRSTGTSDIKRTTNKNCPRLCHSVYWYEAMENYLRIDGEYSVYVSMLLVRGAPRSSRARPTLVLISFALEAAQGRGPHS